MPREAPGPQPAIVRRSVLDGVGFGIPPLVAPCKGVSTLRRSRLGVACVTYLCVMNSYLMQGRLDTPTRDRGLSGYTAQRCTAPGTQIFTPHAQALDHCPPPCYEKSPPSPPRAPALRSSGGLYSIISDFSFGSGTRPPFASRAFVSLSHDSRFTRAASYSAGLPCLETLSRILAMYVVCTNVKSFGNCLG